MPDNTNRTTRRAVLGTGAMGAGLLAAHQPAQAAVGVPLRETLPPPAPAPRGELVNVFEYEEQAKLAQGAAKMAPVTGSDRTITDRITLRPRMNIPTRDLDLTTTLFGDAHFTPIIVGPMADQKRFHPEGEVATARGASAAKAAMVVSSQSSMPLSAITQATTQPLWLQVFAGNPRNKDVLAQASSAKAKAAIVTINAGASGAAASDHIDWAGVDAVVKATTLPVIVKGITHPADAKEAVARGAKGVVVSNWRGGSAAALKGTLLMIAPVAQAVGGQVPVLADGSFRYGADILKALALGAKGVLIGRPVMWGLGAYGADGVQGVVEMLQTDLARIMAMCGRVNLAAVNDSLVRIHAALPPAKNHG
ncbi:MAG: alpha-hydroxy-acid oxidizing protein [Alphaproteobacteria bacterium]